jgi:serine/threonine protein kinase
MASKQAGGSFIGNGRYEIREHIATGGMATVYKAWDTRVERIVAVKVLRSLAKSDSNAVERFRREAHAAARLSHPNAVTVYDFLEERGEHFLIMEYVEGVNLKQLLAEKGKLSAEEAIDITCQVCSVLQMAHAQGFIHRDIKPQNIMITPDDQAKLTDFGIVRVMEAAGLTNSGIVLGTADYLAPEQARGETLSPASDLYSLGVVLYEMLAGRPPFIGSSAVQVAMQHANKIPPPPSMYNPRIPRSLEAVIKKALQKQPQARYSNADEMSKALQESLKTSLEEGATIPGSFPAVEPPSGRRTTGASASSSRPALATRTVTEQPPGPPADWSLRPALSRPPVAHHTPRWAYLLIFLAALVLLGALAVGAFFALNKPAQRSPHMAAHSTAQVSLAQPVPGARAASLRGEGSLPADLILHAPQVPFV